MLAATAVSSVRVIVTPDAPTRWRLTPGGNVERSADSGATWQLQQTGAATALTAGASPSPLVCWLVGPQGIVVLSTDGRSWQRKVFPETVDLTLVSATDDKHAVVTTVDGRTFATTDGGTTWERR
jgi:photosystem II stability/assembly factor-like uncharacterized protein